jgi:hypothetical protein
MTNSMNLRTVISMKMIDCNVLFYCMRVCVFTTPVPELVRFHGSINLFYHRLAYMLYNVLDEDGYLNEDN